MQHHHNSAFDTGSSREWLVCLDACFTVHVGCTVDGLHFVIRSSMRGQHTAQRWGAARGPSSVMILLLFAFTSLVGTAQAAVLAVDLGSEFLKVSIVKPGRTPISIVLNEM